MEHNNNLIRIGVFYDGNYFLHVSNYYNYVHERKSRLSISGIHEFIRILVSEEEKIDRNLCKIVDSHYFRGRLSAQEASSRGNQLYYDRVFDDILMSEGVITHYLPLKSYSGFTKEKGIDVWMALEAYELAFYKRFDVVVLIACDGDYVPLVRKLNTLGTRVMVLSWDFEYQNEDGQKMITRTSQDLLEECTYPIAMHEVINNRLRRNDPLIGNLFVKQPLPGAAPANGKDAAPISPTKSMETYSTSAFNPTSFPAANPAFAAPPVYSASPVYNAAPAYSAAPVYSAPPVYEQTQPVGFVAEHQVSEVLSLNNGFGFLKYPDNNAFFHFSSLVDTDFNDLNIGDKVEFDVEKNKNGGNVAKNVKKIAEVNYNVLVDPFNS